MVVAQEDVDHPVVDIPTDQGDYKLVNQTRENVLQQTGDVAATQKDIDHPFVQSKKHETGDLLSNNIENGLQQTDMGSEDIDVKNKVIEEENVETLIYKVSDNPPVHLCLFFGVQQVLLSISTSMSISLLVSELVCARNEEMIQTQILGTTMMMCGVATFLVSTFGLGLPMFQGPSLAYIVPLLAMSDFKEFHCPNYQVDHRLSSNMTFGNSTSVHDLIYSKIQAISGSLMVSAVIHVVLAFTGLVSILTRYIGPITIVPTITLLGLSLFKAAIKFAEPHWGVTAATTITGLILAIYLNGRKTPLPAYNKQRGFYILWYPLHQVFAILISIAVGWTLSAILTVAGAMSDDVNHIHHFARTDSRNDIIFESPWFYFPYPGQFGGLGFSTAAFISCFLATMLSVIDSIGDYSAAARICKVPPPPSHAVSRGIFLEGVMSVFAGATGACHATCSYGSNLGAMGITKVVSRRTFQVQALLYVVFAIVLKCSAVFVTIPYPVLGGCMVLSYGIFIGLVLSNLQFIDLNSTRNLSVIGMALLLGVMLPTWSASNQDSIQTGNEHVDNVILTFISNGAFVGSFTALFMDNTIKGTAKERGLIISEEKLDEKLFVEGMEVYDVYFVPQFIKISKLYKLLPIFPNENDSN